MTEKLRECIPYLQMLRLVNSGTEATMTALRLAKGFTKRSKLLKFEGCYHGHSDGLLVSAGSGLLTGGITSSAGIPEHVADDMFIAPYNDLTAVESIFTSLSPLHGRQSVARLCTCNGEREVNFIL